jgi:nicotinamidase-related amidase
MLFGVATFDRQDVINKTVALANAAQISDVPTVLSTVETKTFSGYMWPQLKAIFPDQEPIEHSSMNSWDHQKFVVAVERAKRKKLVIALLWTQVCVTFPSIQALHDGYEVFFVIDACGDINQTVHDMAVQRCIQGGAKRLTALQTLLEWQRDWAHRDTYDGVMDIAKSHFGVYGMGIEYAYTMVHSAKPTNYPIYAPPVAAAH